MNIHNLLTDEEVKSIITNLIKYKTESKNLDFKESLIKKNVQYKNFLWNNDNNDEIYKIIKDIIAMANTQYGGKLIFGIDDNYNLVGLTEDEFNSFDQTPINQCLNKYIDPKFHCQVYKTTISEKNVVLIDVPEFNEVPIICKENVNSRNNKLLLKKGTIYIRTPHATSECVSSSDEMRDLIQRATIKKRDELLKTIGKILNNNPINITENIIKQYETEINDSTDFFNDKIKNNIKNKGFWDFSVFPISYDKNRINELPELKKIITSSTLTSRGWPFPYTHNTNDEIGSSHSYSNGFRSHINFDEHLESYCITTSGLFSFQRVLFENHDRSKSVLHINKTIITLTELTLFLKNLYEKIAPNEELKLIIKLNNTYNRKLTRDDDLYFKEYTCMEEMIKYEDVFNFVNLITDYKSIAQKAIKYIFCLFNNYDVNNEFIRQVQDKYFI